MPVVSLSCDVSELHSYDLVNFDHRTTTMHARVPITVSVIHIFLKLKYKTENVDALFREKSRLVVIIIREMYAEKRQTISLARRAVTRTLNMTLSLFGEA